MLKGMVKSPGHPDYIFLFITTILIILGGLILISVSSSISQEKFGSSFYYLNHQILYGLLPGIILAFFAFKINLTLLKKWIPFLLLMNLFLMVMVFLPGVGFYFGGATRWINLGPISFQPSEFLKLTFILYLSCWLASRTPNQDKQDKYGRRQTEKKFSQTFIAFLVVIALVSLLLIFQPDISTLMITALVAALIYFLSNTPLWQNVLIILAVLLILILLIELAPHIYQRIDVFLNPEKDPMGKGYQIKQALIAVGSGGIFGIGLGMSQQKFGFLPQSVLPQSMSDSIFAIFAEEAGFIGSLILVLLYLSFFWRGFKIGGGSQDKFSQLSTFGITFWLTLQTFINIGSTIGILPLAGVPLPFISYGGSHLTSELVGVGILLNISKSSQI